MLVIPAKAGIQPLLVMPAKAGIHLDLAFLARRDYPARFRPPQRRPSHFLDSGHPALRPFGAAFGVRAAPAAQCVAKESNQRKATRAQRPRCARVRVGLRRFSEGTSVYLGKRARFLRAPLRALSSSRRRFTRDPRSRAKSTAKARSKSSCFWRARRAPLLGPLRRGEVGTTRPEGGRAGCAAVFRGTWTYLRKTPAPPHGLFGHGCPKSAPAGCPFSWLLLFGQAKRSDSAAAEADETWRRLRLRREKQDQDGSRLSPG